MLFRRNKKAKSDWAVGLDFGTSQVRGVLFQRVSTTLKLKSTDAQALAATNSNNSAYTAFKYKLEAFDVRPFPFTSGKSENISAAAAVVAELFSALSAPDSCAFAVINPIGTVVCQVELPRMPLPEARAALQLNSARFLHRDLSNYYIDLTEQTLVGTPTPAPKNNKMQLLVGAATRPDVLWYRNVLFAAKVRPLAIELSTLTVVNGLLTTEPELCQKEAILLLDLGARTTSMNFLWRGQLAFTHVMYFGSQQITEHLAQKLGLDLAAAEAEKIKMSEAVQRLVQAAISPLARELRSSIDFFDQQHDCRINRTLACGGVAGSPKILEILGLEVGIRIEVWNCLDRFDTTATRGDQAQLAVVAPELAAAVGVALARLSEWRA